MRQCWFVIILGLLIFYGSPGAAQSSTTFLNLEVEGNAAIRHDDIAGARDEAIRNAGQKAVWEAASALLLIPVENKKFLPVKKEIAERQDKYINNYKIVSESRQPERYSVILHLAVALADLKSDLSRMGFLQISETEKTSAAVSLCARGLKKYSDFQDLKEFLKKRTRIVKNIYLRCFEWQQVYLELEISGPIQELIAELSRTERYILSTEQVNKNQITITLLPKEGE